MTRPDQKKFDQFAQQVQVLDDSLRRFCDANGFQMEVNAYRTPSRVLRRQRLTMEIVDIYLDGDWKTIDYRDDLQCTFSVCSYYETHGLEKKLYKIQKKMDGQDSFLLLASKIDELLQESLGVFDEWVPEVVMAIGEEIENT